MEAELKVEAGANATPRKIILSDKKPSYLLSTPTLGRPPCVSPASDHVPSAPVYITLTIRQTA